MTGGKAVCALYSACYFATAVCNVCVHRIIDYLHTDYSSADYVYIRLRCHGGLHTAWAVGSPSVTSYIHTHWKLNGLRPAESDDGEEGAGPAVAASYRWVSSMARNQPPRLYHRPGVSSSLCLAGRPVHLFPSSYSY